MDYGLWTMDTRQVTAIEVTTVVEVTEVEVPQHSINVEVAQLWTMDT